MHYSLPSKSTPLFELISSSQFNPIPESPVDLLIIAGEASGDQHGSLLLEDLLSAYPSLNCATIGGYCLEQKGAFLVYPLVEHAVVGVIEVLKNYQTFKKIFRDTVDWIKNNKPKVVLLIDYPGFNLRLARELRKQGISQKGAGGTKVLQYVSPQLWAWKPKRRFSMEKVLDALGVIFPFEVECYKDTQLPVSFVGHPFAKPNYNLPVCYDPEGPILILPGSRVQPVERILPIFLDAFEQMLKVKPDLSAIIPVPDQRIRELVEYLLEQRPENSENIQVIEGTENLSAQAALMSSGTMSLSCALAGIPGVIAYRAHPLTYLLGRFLVKVPYLGMANILLPKSPPYQEFLQNRANGKVLSSSMLRIISNDQARIESDRNAKKLFACLSSSSERSVVDWLVQEGSLT